MSRYVKPGVAEQVLGVDRRTLFKWSQSGAIRCIQPSGEHGQRLYDLNSVTADTSGASATAAAVSTTAGGGLGRGDPAGANDGRRRDYIYARVSTRKQSDDLKTQIANLKARHPDAHVLSDCASGLNFKRKGLKTLLELAYEGRVRSVFIAHRDRLCRFAYDMLEYVLKLHGAKIVVDAHDPESAISPELELADDVLAVVTVFGARLYGRRSAGGRKRKRDATATLQAAEAVEGVVQGAVDGEGGGASTDSDSGESSASGGGGGGGGGGGSPEEAQDSHEQAQASD